MQEDDTPLAPQTPAESSETDAAMQQAISLLESGLSLNAIIESLFASLPEPEKQRILHRLQAIQQEREARQHAMAQQTREKSAEHTTRKLMGLSFLTGILSRESIEKIQQLPCAKPRPEP